MAEAKNLSVRERYDAITNYIKKYNSTTKKACEAFGEPPSFYSGNKKRFGNAPTKGNRKKIKRERFIDLPE